MNPVNLYVVDDYLLARIAYRRYFADDNEIKLIEDFSSADECIEKMKTKQADIILMDIELPNINGIEATKIIKEKFPKTKVIICTSYKNEQRILASLACGACGYVLKNSSQTDLKNIIKNVAKGDFYMDLEIAKLAFSLIPTPNVNDLENLYENKNITNTLTAREMEVLKLLIDGKTNSQIAQEIIVSINTAKAHVGNILTKLSVTDRVQAAVKAVRANMF
ncbi:MAG: response regulator transcription factor [Candidatus Gastranaerophilales bacterium]|nr:response regulator transcription factor [Candidatus Gastranaerophilales bacterium]